MQTNITYHDDEDQGGVRGAAGRGGLAMAIFRHLIQCFIKLVTALTKVNIKIKMDNANFLTKSSRNK